MNREEIIKAAGKLDLRPDREWLWAETVRSGEDSLVQALETDVFSHEYKAMKLRELLAEARKIEEENP